MVLKVDGPEPIADCPVRPAEIYSELFTVGRSSHRDARDNLPNLSDGLKLSGSSALADALHMEGLRRTDA